MMMAAMPAMMYMTMMFGSLGVLIGSKSPSLSGELSLEWPTSNGLQEENLHSGRIFYSFLPWHVGLDNVAHLPNVALIVSGKKDVVQVFVHVSLAHCHPVNIVNISSAAQMWSVEKV